MHIAILSRNRSLYSTRRLVIGDRVVASMKHQAREGGGDSICIVAALPASSV